MDPVANSYASLARTLQQGIAGTGRARLQEADISLAEARQTASQERFKKYEAPVLQEQVNEVNRLNEPMLVSEAAPKDLLSTAGHFLTDILPKYEEVLGATVSDDGKHFVKNADGMPVTVREWRRMSPVLYGTALGATDPGKALEDQVARLEVNLTATPSDEMSSRLATARESLEAFRRDPEPFYRKKRAQLEQIRGYLVAQGVNEKTLASMDRDIARLDQEVERTAGAKGTEREQKTAKEWAADLAMTGKARGQFLQMFKDPSSMVSRREAENARSLAMGQTEGPKEKKPVSEWLDELPMSPGQRRYAESLFKGKSQKVTRENIDAVFKGLTADPKNLMEFQIQGLADQILDMRDQIGKMPEGSDRDAARAKYDGMVDRLGVLDALRNRGRSGKLTGADLKNLQDAAESAWGSLTEEQQGQFDGGFEQFQKDWVAQGVAMIGGTRDNLQALLKEIPGAPGGQGKKDAGTGKKKWEAYRKPGKNAGKKREWSPEDMDKAMGGVSMESALGLVDTPVDATAPARAAAPSGSSLAGARALEAIKRRAPAPKAPDPAPKAPAPAPKAPAPKAPVPGVDARRVSAPPPDFDFAAPIRKPQPVDYGPKGPGPRMEPFRGPTTLAEASLRDINTLGDLRKRNIAIFTTGKAHTVGLGTKKVLVSALQDRFPGKKPMWYGMVARQLLRVTGLSEGQLAKHVEKKQILRDEK